MHTHIAFYRSSLCPRCFVAGRYLKELAAADPAIEIEEIDIMRAPRRTWQDGIRMIPAIKIGNRILSGVWLSKHAIAACIAENRS